MSRKAYGMAQMLEVLGLTLEQIGNKLVLGGGAVEIVRTAGRQRTAPPPYCYLARPKELLKVN